MNLENLTPYGNIILCNKIDTNLFKVPNSKNDNSPIFFEVKNGGTTEFVAGDLVVVRSYTALEVRIKKQTVYPVQLDDIIAFIKKEDKNEL